MALTRGPYQTFLALSWEAGRDSRVYQIEANAHALPTVRASWKVCAIRRDKDTLVDRHCADRRISLST